MYTVCLWIKTENTVDMSRLCLLNLHDRLMVTQNVPCFPGHTYIACFILSPVAYHVSTRNNNKWESNTQEKKIFS